ncbi:DUF4105 domain-containing protein [Dysgonomonas sp. HGC4]|uniref:lipoprotein N-acyltransferase Lnb domain-containing protein n=1 Tax=Dysgonomonas sp. HGC4 TaxID=1658009 RepID=UPI000682AB86|nr:DUF4105 domain-containing protein [Dysgonomonas sp. HGC4]MBD8348319.1 DUF4105 domain-containing protein [Dysgonomonas sp. HGC4]
MIKRLLYTILIFYISILHLSAQQIQLSDSAKVSLLTSAPWEKEVYALFGHTAIRIQDPINQFDLVFNYGLFSFDSPNFMLRFIKGETDYMVGAENFNRYISEYKSRGVGITEQVFNLTQQEKQAVFDALAINSLPENRVYRYNYFYDNCSTRPRDIIENNIHGTIHYTPTKEKQTYRDLVHECVWAQPWVRFGIDLVIGADADKEITDRQKKFLPLYLMSAYNNANIKSTDGNTRALLSEQNDILLSPKNDTIILIDPPLAIGCLLLVITLIISFLSYKKNCILLGKIFDTFLFITAGVAGSIIFFLMFFSVHPCTNPNWNIIWLNPFQLIFAFFFLIKFFSKYVYYYHFINFVALILLLLAWFLIPQYLELAFIPYILSLCVRSGTNVLQYKNRS